MTSRQSQAEVRRTVLLTGILIDRQINRALQLKRIRIPQGGGFV